MTSTAAAPALPYRSGSWNWKPYAEGALGIVALLLLWQGLVDFVFSARGTIPSPLQIVQQFFWVDGPAFYFESASHTLHAAIQGWCWGNLLAIAVAVLAATVPRMERPMLLLGTVAYCLPIVAIGPILVITTSGETPRIVLAAMAVFYPMLIGTLLGLRSPSTAMLDLIHALGGGGITVLAKIRWRAALPQFFASLRVSAPSAILGSIIGEFLGAENGLGVLLINAQQGLNYERTWTIALFSTVVAGAAYGLIRLVGSWLTPWARETHSNLAAGTSARATKSTGTVGIVLNALISATLSILLVLAVWWLLLKVLQVSPFIGKGPVDVWNYFFDPDSGAENRADLLAESGVTLRDAGLGLFSGTLAALLVAALFQAIPAASRIFMGPALALQSVPLIAMTPLIVLIFGRNLGAIAVIGGIVTFFPTLVNVTLALSRTPKDAMDLVSVFGASQLKTLRIVQIPYALPALFASLRVAAPLSITGALLAEWLATGNGLGYAIMSDVATADYSALWTRVTLATLYSLLIYNLIAATERFVRK
jgi:ABC-type nitrate/sulfonate/bicarbonate transport system permease component